MLTVKQVPYTGPFSSDATKFPHFSPTIEALKRAVSRLGYIEWKGLDFTQAWPADGVFDKGFRKWQQDEQLPADGVYGNQTWKEMRTAKVPAGRPNAGEYALDKYACKLIRDEWAAENVPDEADFRAALVLFCQKGFRNEDNWHYHAIRPLDVTIEPDAAYIVSDCSFSVKQGYKWSSTRSGLVVPDPAVGHNWDGYGNTDSLAENPRISSPYKVGDVALYSGGTGHATMCYRAGDAWTSSWWSHGQEAGPMPTSLHYRSDLRFVVRPPLK